MKRIPFIFIVFSVIIFLFSCEKKEEVAEYGSLYGTVADMNTGSRIRTASVELRPVGLQTVTGSDGQYEFPKVEEGQYQLYVTKSGYEDYKTEIDVKGNTDAKKVDILLEPLPPALTIIDDNGQKIDSLDFGADEGSTMRSFTIFNNGEDKLEWNITYDYDCKWIKSFSKTEGEIAANKTQSITCSIDRNKLNLGDNSTDVHIVSNSGSKILKVKAKSINVVETLEATDIESHSALLHGYIIRNLDPAITEYGFVYSQKETPTLTNGAQKICNQSSPQRGEYSMTVDNLDKEMKYYACAYVTNENGTIYGEQITFTTISYTPVICILDDSPYEPASTATTITIYYETRDGGRPIEEVGICWDTKRVPTKDNQYLKIGDDAQSNKEVMITDLEPSTTYYIRAYVRNTEEEDYSEEYALATKSGEPAAETIRQYSYGADYLTLSGKTTSPDDIPLIRQGICYSTISSSPTIYDSFITSDNITSPFTCQLNNLNGCTNYYYCAFAENKYGIGYGKPFTAKTACEPATLKGYVYDQDGNPIKNAKVGVGKTDGTYNSEYSAYSGLTDGQGYYEISFPVNTTRTWTMLATADDFVYQTKDIVINTEQKHQLDFTLNLEHSFAVDFGTGIFSYPGTPWEMYFDCSQSYLAGKTVTRNLRIKNYRSVPVSWSITNIPTTGVSFSVKNGNISAKGEISIQVIFTYPSTASYMVLLTGCESGTKAYIWNWDAAYAGYYVNNGTAIQSACSACCWQNPIIKVDDYSEAYTILFNQFVVYK